MIGELIKKEREKRGWSQEALALVSGISQRSIGHYELRQRDPQFMTISKIMGAMGMKIQFVNLAELNKHIPVEPINGKCNECGWILSIQDNYCACCGQKIKKDIDQ